MWLLLNNKSTSLINLHKHNYFRKSSEDIIVVKADCDALPFELRYDSQETRDNDYKRLVDILTNTIYPVAGR